MSSDNGVESFLGIMEANRIDLPDEGVAKLTDDPEVRRLVRWLHGLDYHPDVRPPSARQYSSVVGSLRHDHDLDAGDVAEVFRIILEEEDVEGSYGEA